VLPFTGVFGCLAAHLLKPAGFICGAKARCRYQFPALNKQRLLRVDPHTIRLPDRCVIAAKQSNPVEVRQSIDILFGPLKHIDKGNDDVIFFADAGGSWQVVVDWAKVLPVWFKVLSATAGRRSTPRVDHGLAFLPLLLRP